MSTPQTQAAPAAPTKRGRTAWRAVKNVLGALVVAGLVWFLWPAAFGGHLSMTLVRGHSMDPTYATGDVVVGWREPAQLGDVIVYEVPELGGNIVHRVIGQDDDGWITQGDNNDWRDPFRPTSDDVLGVVRWHVTVPAAVGALATSPTLWLSLTLVGAGVLVWPARTRAIVEQDGGPAPDDEPDPIMEPAAGPQARQDELASPIAR